MWWCSLIVQMSVFLRRTFDFSNDCRSSHYRQQSMSWPKVTPFTVKLKFCFVKSFSKKKKGTNSIFQKEKSLCNIFLVFFIVIIIGIMISFIITCFKDKSVIGFPLTSLGSFWDLLLTWQLNLHKEIRLENDKSQNPLLPISVAYFRQTWSS